MTVNIDTMNTVNRIHNWSVYIILAANNSLYTGITNNMSRRWRQHRQTVKGATGRGTKGRGAKFFRGNRPFALCYQEPNHTRQTASRREYTIKQLSRNDKWNLILANYGPNKND